MVSNRDYRRSIFTVLPGQGRKYVHLKKAAAYYLMLAMVAVLVLQAGYHWVGAQLLLKRLQMTVAEPGYMEDAAVVGGIVTRQEEVLTSPCTGVLVELRPPGERVSGRTPLVSVLTVSREDLELYLKSEQKNLWEKLGEVFKRWFQNEDDVAEERLVLPVSGEPPPWFKEKTIVHNDGPGLLSYQLDGWEDTPSFPYYDKEKFEELYEVLPPVEEGLFVEEGAPLAKIVNNWGWYFSTQLPADPGLQLAELEEIMMTFDFAPGQTARAAVVECSIDEDGTGEPRVRLTYFIDRQLPGVENVRWTEAVVIYRRDYGINIPEKALFEKEGECGVFLNEGGTVYFYPVEVLRREEDRALIEGIPPFSLVITRPELVREGQRLD